MPQTARAGCDGVHHHPADGTRRPAPVDEPAWSRPTPQQRDEVLDTYLDSARTALRDRVVNLCRTVSVSA